MIAGFQLFSTYLPINIIQQTGCGGIKADLFDMNYDTFDEIGNDQVQNEAAISSCNAETGNMSGCVPLLL